MTKESINKKIFIYQMHQDDPRKCTSARLIRFKLAKPIHYRNRLLKKMIVLNPFADKPVFPGDKAIIEEYGIVAIDCSWMYTQEVFSKKFPGKNLRLPTLLAGNPVNYGHPLKLSTVEALIAAFFIAQLRKEAAVLERTVKWGSTFMQLNLQPLQEYSLAKSRQEIESIEKLYF